MASTLATQPALAAFSPLSPAWLKGRMRGALICGTFGAVWMFEALFFGGAATPAWLTIVSVFTVAAVAWPVVRLRALRGVPYSAADRARWAAVAPAYWINCGVEWALCFGSALWLARTHRYALIPECLGAIIGLHFLPLGKMFRSPLYYATGVAMVVGSLAALAIDAGLLRNIASFGWNGVVLWATAAVILSQDLSSNRDGRTSTEGGN